MQITLPCVSIAPRTVFVYLVFGAALVMHGCGDRSGVPGVVFGVQ